MVKLGEALVGERVIYVPFGYPAQRGWVNAVNEKYAFVQYDGDNHSKATAPEQLFLLEEK